MFRVPWISLTHLKKETLIPILSFINFNLLLSTFEASYRQPPPPFHFHPHHPFLSNSPLLSEISSGSSRIFQKFLRSIHLNKITFEFICLAFEKAVFNENYLCSLQPR